MTLFFVGEIDDSLKEIFIRHRSSGIIGVVDPEKLCLFCHLCAESNRDCREEVIFSFQRQEVIFAPAECSADVVDRVTGAGDQNNIAGIHEGYGHITDAFFGPDERDDLFSGIQFDVKPLSIPVCDRLAKLRRALNC